MLTYTKPILRLGINNGYHYFCDSSHPLADTSTRVYLHRHVASIKLGRWLSKEEHVHHIDGNRLNNDISNLQVLTAQEHASLHRGGILIKYICKSCNTSFISGEISRTYCSNQCKIRGSIKTSLTKEELECLMAENTWTSLARLLGYSDNGIKKRAKNLGCDLSLINKWTIRD